MMEECKPPGRGCPSPMRFGALQEKLPTYPRRCTKRLQDQPLRFPEYGKQPSRELQPLIELRIHAAFACGKFRGASELFSGLGYRAGVTQCNNPEWRMAFVQLLAPLLPQDLLAVSAVLRFGPHFRVPHYGCPTPRATSVPSSYGARVHHQQLPRWWRTNEQARITLNPSTYPFIVEELQRTGQLGMTWVTEPKALTLLGTLVRHFRLESKRCPITVQQSWHERFSEPPQVL